MAIVPDFIIIGGQKCGTTAAVRNLSLHPGIDIFRGVTEYGQQEIQFFNQHWDRGMPWYASHFRGNGTLEGEKTAELLHRTVCHQRMYLTNPSFKVIALLRSPVERAYSQWKMAALHKRDEPETFETVVARELSLLNNDSYRSEFYNCHNAGISGWREGYLLKGMYAEQLESVYQWLPKEQVYVGISERIRADMRKGYSPIFEFLGLPSYSGQYSQHFIGPSGPPMSPQMRSILVELYKPYNERLFSLIGEEVHEWE